MINVTTMLEFAYYDGKKRSACKFGFFFFFVKGQIILQAVWATHNIFTVSLCSFSLSFTFFFLSLSSSLPSFLLLLLLLYFFLSYNPLKCKNYSYLIGYTQTAHQLDSACWLQLLQSILTFPPVSIKTFTHEKLCDVCPLQPRDNDDNWTADLKFLMSVGE